MAAEAKCRRCGLTVMWWEASALPYIADLVEYAVSRHDVVACTNPTDDGLAVRDVEQIWAKKPRLRGAA